MDVARFWKKVDVQDEDSCWNWLFAVDKDGYGRVSQNRKMKFAHRVGYTISIGEIPMGEQVLHSCDNPSCVNPKHLFLGNNHDNIKDKVSKKRSFHSDETRLNMSKKKIGEVTAKEIRERYRAGNYTQKDLSLIFSMSIRSVRNIIKGDTY